MTLIPIILNYLFLQVSFIKYLYIENDYNRNWYGGLTFVFLLVNEDFYLSQIHYG